MICNCHLPLCFVTFVAEKKDNKAEAVHQSSLINKLQPAVHGHWAKSSGQCMTPFKPSHQFILLRLRFA